MFSGLFQTLLVPTRTPAEQDADAAATNGSPVVDAPAPVEGAVTSPPAAAGELPLPAAAGNGAIATHPDARANPAVPAGIALAAILAGVVIVLAYPDHRARPQKAAAAPTPGPTVTGPARGAFSPLASTELMTLDPSKMKAPAAGAAPAAKKSTPAKPAASPAPTTPPAAEVPADGSDGGSSGGTSSTPSSSGSNQSSSQKQSGGATKPAPLTATGTASLSGDWATLRFTFKRRGGKGTVDRIRLVVSSGDTPLRIAKYDAKGLGRYVGQRCRYPGTRRDTLVCTVPLRLGKPYTLKVQTAPAPGIDFVGKLYGRPAGGKEAGPFDIEE